MEPTTAPAGAAGLPTWAQIVLGVFSLAGLAIATIGTVKSKGKEVSKTDAQQLIDQYQEGRKEDQVRIEALETKVEGLSKRDTQFRLYVFKLHQHINAGFPPPPPEWPEGLL